MAETDQRNSCKHLSVVHSRPFVECKAGKWFLPGPASLPPNSDACRDLLWLKGSAKPLQHLPVVHSRQFVERSASRWSLPCPDSVPPYSNACNSFVWLKGSAKQLQTSFCSSFPDCSWNANASTRSLSCPDSIPSYLMLVGASCG